MMDERKKKQQDYDGVAPGIDPDDAFGQNASENDIKRGESTKVTRLIYDEYDPDQS
ncbi:hypothetical protein GCM10008983_01760 [Lentibacillus halophilus]|uniref:DUF4025 domain-containing protein n=1 Tax=Lentibacillus halophilus TaxID=295065 RepID=A0ABP3IVJ2_9BACI